MIFYDLFVRPIELLIEIIFMIVYRLTQNPGLCILGVSIAVNLLVLPIYNRADDVQNEERKKQADMSGWVNHIKKSFKGDERMMMLQTYYRQQDYKPIYAVRSSISVLLQIPFFIAAYHFLSHLDLLENASCGPLKDLSNPDGLIFLFGTHINLLPILMTGINLLSAMIYAKGMTRKEIIQAPVLALLFLVLLYKSPAGLVLYWTLNNLFSLFKNLFKKFLKNPGNVLGAVIATGGIACSGYLFSHYWSVAFKFRFLCIVVLLVSCLPLAIMLLSKMISLATKMSRDNSNDNKINFLAEIILIVLMGVLIPSSVIRPSPTEYFEYGYFVHPFHYILTTLLLSVGFFGIWEMVFYYLGKKSTRSVVSKIMLIGAYCFVGTFMLFGNKLGNITPDMVFDNIPAYGSKTVLLNVLLILALAAGVWFFCGRFPKFIGGLSVAVCVSLAFLSAVNMSDIQKKLNAEASWQAGAENDRGSIAGHSGSELFSLSRNSDNVVVIMLDRAISAYIPYIMEERPELRQQFEDFVYYPNTVSFGNGTIHSTSSLFGGYEYTPEEMINRTDKTFAELQNEALKVMPVLFEENGYDVTVCDPPFAGFQWIPDLTIYDDYPDIHRYITKGMYSQLYTNEDPSENVERRERSMFCYSIFKCMPVAIQPVFYDSGYYWSSNSANAAFINQYSTLACLPKITGVNDEDTGTFFMIDNDTTHEPCELQLPDYIPLRSVDNTGLETGKRTLSDGSSFVLDERYHYHVNMAAMIKLGEWMDYLKESGVYDNTKIVIVSDHGSDLKQFDDMLIRVDGNDFDVQWYNPLLLYKDINKSEDHREITVSDEFMTLADVPALASHGTLDNPDNPFSGKELRFKDKGERVKICVGGGWNTASADLYELDHPTVFYSVSDSIFDELNWRKESTD